MAYAMDWKKILIISALLLAPLALMNCGSAGENNSASSRVGPKGPTDPSKLYFDLTAESIVVQSGGTAAFTVRVRDSLGNVAGGVSVLFSGAGTWTGNPGTTNLNGVVSGTLAITGGAGTLAYVTATVEDMSLTIPVQVLPTGGPPAK
jgi:hypothetical protein